MAYGNILTDVIQSSTTGTAPVFKDGNGTQIGTLCRAWVNFNGTTSPGTIRAAFNVSSVTKNGTGDYTVNFTTAMPDANYCALTSGDDIDHSTGAYYSYYTTTSVRVWQFLSDINTYGDATAFGVGIFR